jgi:hypothetical protein
MGFTAPSKAPFVSRNPTQRFGGSTSSQLLPVRVGAAPLHQIADAAKAWSNTMPRGGSGTRPRWQCARESPEPIQYASMSVASAGARKLNGRGRHGPSVCAVYNIRNASDGMSLKSGNCSTTTCGRTGSTVSARGALRILRLSTRNTRLQSLSRKDVCTGPATHCCTAGPAGRRVGCSGE